MGSCTTARGRHYLLLISLAANALPKPTRIPINLRVTY